MRTTLYWHAGVTLVQNDAPTDPHGRTPRVERTVWYELPLNERIRTWLRLEFLFARVAHAAAGHSVWDSRAALEGLLDVFNLLGRSEPRTELLKDLDRHATTLARLGGSRLDPLRAELDAIVAAIHALDTRRIEEVRQGDFLVALRQRNSIPGGTCQFDLPALHHWLQREPEVRFEQIGQWLEPLEALRQGVTLLLRIVRAAAEPADEIAYGGFYQQSLDAAAPSQLVRVALPGAVDVFPEISGGRHRFSIRFMRQPNPAQRPFQTDDDVGFALACCVI